MELTFIGDENTDSYGSTDPETGQSIRVEPGDVVEVSDEKGKQMLRDFPGWFEKGRRASSKKGSEPAGDQAPAPAEEDEEPEHPRAATRGRKS